MIKNINNIVTYQELYISIYYLYLSPLWPTRFWYNPFIFAEFSGFMIRLLAVCAKSILSINTEIPSVCYWHQSANQYHWFVPQSSHWFLPNISWKYILFIYQTRLSRNHLRISFTTFLINWNGSDLQFSGWLAHYMKTIFVGGGGASIRYAVKHMHIYWPNPRLLYTSGFPRHTIHTHSQPIGRADKYQEQKRQ